MKLASSTLNTLKSNPGWATLPLFDHTSWKLMAFGEIAGSIGERAEPKDAQVEIYVGGGTSGPAVPAHPALGEGQR